MLLRLCCLDYVVGYSRPYGQVALGDVVLSDVALDDVA